MEEVARAIYQHSAIGMAVCDLAGRFLNVNAAMCRFLGYDAAELLTRTFMDVTHPDDIALNVRERAALLDGGGDAFQLEKRYLHKSGRVLWALTVVSAVRDVQGVPQYTIGQMLDINQLKTTEQALRVSRAGLASAQRMAQIGDWSWDILDNTIQWSDEIYRIFGVDKHRVTVSYDLFLNRVHRDDRALVDDAVTQAIAKQGNYEVDHRIVMDDGSVKVVHEIGSVRYDEHSNAIRMVGTVQDITERYLHDQTVREYHEQIQRLVAHNNLLIEAERKRIAQEVHDEIGQLLTVLKIDMQLYRSITAGESPLRQHTEDMLGLIDQTIAAVRNVTHNLRPPALNVGLVAALEWLTRDMARRTQLQFSLDCACHGVVIDDQVATAAFRIAQESITNIIRHAHATRVVIALHYRQAKLHLNIADNGCGFDTEKGFHQSGFGLLGMRERVAALGGEFSIKSSAKTGTTVRIALPVKLPS